MWKLEALAFGPTEIESNNKQRFSAGKSEYTSLKMPIESGLRASLPVVAQKGLAALHTECPLGEACTAYVRCLPEACL